MTKILKLKGYFIYNIPGGPGVSLGGAVAGNVHGRLSDINYSTFGDNIISLKIIDNNLKIKVITKKNKLFNQLVGSLGNYGIIIEAKLQINKIKNYYFVEKTNYINSTKQFRNFNKKNNKYFGYINYFNKKFEFNARTITPSINQKKDNNFEEIKKISLPKQMWVFVNILTLYVLYFLLFKFKNKLFDGSVRLLSLEKTIYVSSYITKLPLFFKNGFIEIQFSVSEKKLLEIINTLKYLIKKMKVYPIFFILKKLNKSKKKYTFNFPVFKHSISLGFSKKQYTENKNFFSKFYNILNSNNCNIYVTKDEIFSNFSNKKLKSDIKFSKYRSNYNSSNFIKKII